MYVKDTYADLYCVPSRKRGTSKRIHIIVFCTHLICGHIIKGVQSDIPKNIRLNTILISYEAEP